jgi:hypothetical protein
MLQHKDLAKTLRRMWVEGGRGLSDAAVVAALASAAREPAAAPRAAWGCRGGGCWAGGTGCRAPQAQERRLLPGAPDGAELLLTGAALLRPNVELLLMGLHVGVVNMLLHSVIKVVASPVGLEWESVGTSCGDSWGCERCVQGRRCAGVVWPSLPSPVTDCQDLVG